jgi:hypothetical protein
MEGEVEDDGSTEDEDGDEAAKHCDLVEDGPQPVVTSCLSNSYSDRSARP